MRHWEQHTCVKFVEKLSSPSLSFSNNNNNKRKKNNIDQHDFIYFTQESCGHVS